MVKYSLHKIRKITIHLLVQDLLQLQINLKKYQFKILEVEKVLLDRAMILCRFLKNQIMKDLSHSIRIFKTLHIQENLLICKLWILKICHKLFQKQNKNINQIRKINKTEYSIFKLGVRNNR